MRKNFTRQVSSLKSVESSRNHSEIKSYECGACSERFEERLSRCPLCSAFDTFFHIADIAETSQEVFETRDDRRAKRATDIPTRLPSPVSTGRPAWDAALGGGLVLPSSVLVYGPRGVGKSTSTLRIGLDVAKRLRGAVLYGSAEMPAPHVRMIVDRLGLKGIDRLWISDTGSAEDLVTDIEEIQPKVIVWDSIQRFKWDGLLGEVELRNVVHAAIEAGVSVGAASLLISQVTKDEDFIGSNGIGHDVDVLLTLRSAGPNLVSVECLEKNRFAPTPLVATENLYEV